MILQFSKYSRYYLVKQIYYTTGGTLLPSEVYMKASVVFTSGCPECGQIFVVNIWLSVAKTLCFRHKLDIPKSCLARLLTIHCVQIPRNIPVSSN